MRFTVLARADARAEAAPAETLGPCPVRSAATALHSVRPRDWRRKDYSSPSSQRQLATGLAAMTAARLETSGDYMYIGPRFAEVQPGR